MKFPEITTSFYASKIGLIDSTLPRTSGHGMNRTFASSGGTPCCWESRCSSRTSVLASAVRLARRVGPERPHARRAGPVPRGGTRSGPPLTA
jgi:hypothetical protein